METEWKPMWMRSPKQGRAHVYKLEGTWYTEWYDGAEGAYSHAHAMRLAVWAVR